MGQYSTSHSCWKWSHGSISFDYGNFEDTNPMGKNLEDINSLDVRHGGFSKLVDICFFDNYYFEMKEKV